MVAGFFVHFASPAIPVSTLVGPVRTASVPSWASSRPIVLRCTVCFGIIYTSRQASMSAYIYICIHTGRRLHAHATPPHHDLTKGSWSIGYLQHWGQHRYSISSITSEVLKDPPGGLKRGSPPGPDPFLKFTISRRPPGALKPSLAPILALGPMPAPGPAWCASGTRLHST